MGKYKSVMEPSREELLYNAISTRVTDYPHDTEAMRDLMDIAWSLGRDDELGRVMAHSVGEFAQTGMALGAPTARVLRSLRDVLGRSLLFRSWYDVDAYFQYLEWNRDVEKRFYLPRRRQLRPLIDGLQTVLDDEVDILTVSMPPGSGKTTSGIFFITMLMGLFPEKYNLVSAHAGGLTRSIFEGLHQIIMDDYEYQWRKIFPGTRIESVSFKDTYINLGNTKRFKTVTCRPINASLTGATRCNGVLYADDLVSGIEEAMNPERLTNLWMKYTNDLKSRKLDGCKEIHVATRWSVHDVVGRVQRQYDDDQRAVFISMPALDENDESLFDYDFGVGFTTEYFHDMRANMDEVSWACLYMNEPIEREGLLYPESELRRFYELPEDEPDAIIAVCDSKDTGADYAVLPVAYVYGTDYYIADCVCDNGRTGRVDAKLVDILVRHKVQACRFESNSAGGRVADDVNRKVQERGGITHITKKFSQAHKDTRIYVNSQWVKNHCLFLDRSEIPRGSDYARMMRFLTTHTATGKNTYDDVPDAMSMLSDFARRMTRSSVEVFRSPFR